MGEAESAYLFGAIFDVLDELITRNRAYQKALEELVSPTELGAQIRRIENLRPAVSEPQIYNDLRKRAILAAEDHNPDEFVSLARELSDRTHLWI
ncbi:MAG TPA: hypothetical protein VGT08_17950 [Terracidiphilus sp.]|nr:hypothetical protein [Terracidiphilus sp.]